MFDMSYRTCATPACSGKMYGNTGRCKSCHRRGWYAGRAVTHPSVRSMSLRERWLYYAVPGDGPDECWGWTGSIRLGKRPFIKFAGQEISAGRLAWYAMTDRWPNVRVGHRCGNLLCTNPSHLYARARYTYIPGQNKHLWDDASDEEL